MSKRSKPWICCAENPCKYNVNKECVAEIKDCRACSKNDRRFEGRSITKGQIIFLESKGYKKEEIESWEYIKACREISRLKGNNFLM